MIGTHGRRRGRAAVVALALAVGGCGPYADVAQKLDVTARVAGDTWIAAAGPDRSEIRVLIVGRPQADGTAPFAFCAMAVPITRGTSAMTLQGTWIEVGASGSTTLQVAHEYTLPDESSVPLFSRRGTFRDDEALTIPVTVTRAGGTLTVAGDARVAGTYVPLGRALAALGTATDRDAACAFQIANLGIFSSETRIIGFNGPGMSQYQRAETYIGTVAGSVWISVTDVLKSPITTTILYSGFEDLGGVRVDGPQITVADRGGDGRMAGVMAFTLTPLAVDGSVLPPITGSIDYGSSDPIQISGGTATGGVYVVSIDGGGSARVPPQTAPAPSASDCLGLP